MQGLTVEKPKQQRVRFSHEEIIMFVRGYNTYKSYSNPYARIANCPEMGFRSGFGGKIRDKQNLRDLHRNLTKNSRLLMDANGEYYYYDTKNHIPRL